jgi:sterol desaturase/sphingolipid hydroxylase (fatty acid hydroxylase superfamily)
LTTKRDQRIPSLDRWFERAFGDAEPSRFGTGWASGVASVFLASVALGAVVVLWFPGWLSTARFRPLYPLPFLRAVIEVAIVIAFVLGATSIFLRRRKVLGLTGCALSLVAALLGGGNVETRDGASSSATLGLDWFLLNLLLLALLFVPLEKLFPQRSGQSTFRPEWTTDGVYFLVSHVLVQSLSFFILLPATTLGRVWHPEGLQAAIRSQPTLLQLLEIVLVADLAQYAVHRAFHRVPVLWRFHEVHHSSRDLDWLAGSRLHLLDALATRALVLVPLSLLGFAEGALGGYLVFVSFHAVFIHANVRFRLTHIEPVLVTPRFHHWHHAAEPEARDRNFAVHLPWLDRLFGTAYFPAERWPARYGLQHDPVPAGYLRQLAYPFGRGR